MEIVFINNNKRKEEKTSSARRLRFHCLERVRIDFKPITNASEIGHFFILHSDEQTGFFAKFVTNQEDGLDDNKKEQDVVLYQIVSKANGIYVDICMEASHSTFYPFSQRRSPNTTFAKLSERVKRRDQDCARNVKR